MTLGRVFITCLCLAILCVAAFLLLTPGIVNGDLPAFDARIGGYDVSSARAYLIHLDAKGLTDQYLGLYGWLDTIFPIVVYGLFVTAIWGFWGRPFPAIAVLGVLVAIGYAVADFVENTSSRALIKAGVDGVTPEAVNIASSATQGKWVAVFACVMLIVLGLLVTLVRGRD